MNEGALTAAERRRSIAAVIASLTVQALIFGLSYPLLALVLEEQGIDKSMNGLSSATQSLAVFAVAPFFGRLVAELGLARLMIASTLLSIVAFMLLPAFPNVYAWFPLRFVLGAGSTVVWIAGEVWINQIVEERTRGRIVALYSASLSGGMAAGPLVLAQTGTNGWLPFLAVAVLIAISVVPLLLAADLSPRTSGRPSARLPAYLLLAPAALLLNGVFAATDMAILTFLPIYALSLGLDQASSLYLLSVLALGGLAFQIPLGWLADHMDRMLLVILSVILMIAGVAAMPFAVTAAPWNMVYIFVVGGVFASLYSLALILLGERFQGADLASASAMFGVMWGVGSIVGPPIGGEGMELWHPHGLPLALGLMFLAYLPFPVVEYVRRRRGPAGGGGRRAG